MLGTKAWYTDGKYLSIFLKVTFYWLLGLFMCLFGDRLSKTLKIQVVLYLWCSLHVF